MAAYVLGEYGSLLQGRTSPKEIFLLLQDRFMTATLNTRALLLSAYLKLLVMDPNDHELRSLVTGVFERYRKVMDAELQQRAVEYLVRSID